MYRWNSVVTQNNGLKLYRPLVSPEYTTISRNNITELDHVAYRFLGTELYTYKLLDLNFVEYMEHRGDLSKIDNIRIPKE